MLVWATEFPVPRTATPGLVHEICVDWMVGSPHYGLGVGDVPGLPSPDEAPAERTATVGDQDICVARVERDGGQIAGVSHARCDNEGRQWRTEVVFSSNSVGSIVSIRVHCVQLEHTHVPPQPNKPYVVRRVLERLGGALDGWLPVGDSPLFLREAQVDEAVRLILGKSKSSLPVVYVSARFSGGYAVDPVQLAQRLGGVAHVLVEPSRVFSNVLARACEWRNAYGGAIAVHWPRSDGQYRVVPSGGRAPRAIVSEVEECLRVAIAHSPATTSATWEYLRESIAHQRLTTLREEGTGELQEFIDNFDSELAAKDAQIAEVQAQANRLRQELAKRDAQQHLAGEGLLRLGEEAPLYQGELRDAVVAALRAGRDQLHSDGRRQNIIDDLLLANDVSEAETELTEGIKDCLSSADRIGTRERKRLAELGFDISDGGKHYRAVWKGDDRYTFTIPNTPSDHRSMKNNASHIVRRLFL